MLVAIDAAAERLGLRKTMALAQARAMHPDLAAVPEDAAADAHLIDAVADWCARYTPLVAVDPPDGILLDIGGCAHLFGGEEKLRDDLAARMSGFGFTVRAAIAPTIGAAFAATHFGATDIADGDERAALAPLPLAALRLSPEIVAALARVGLKRIGDILDMPRAPLAARFGADLIRRLDRALGREREPLSPRLPVAPYVAERLFAEPIAREEDVLRVIERLAARLKTAMERRGDGARRVELALFRTDGVVKRIAAATSRPVRDPHDIQALFVERLAALGDEVDPGFGFDLVRLSVSLAEACPDEQIGLNGGDDGEIDRLVDRLSARLGRRRVTRLIAQDSHIPELATLAAPAQATATAESGWPAFRRFRDDADLAPRPLRLLAKPEPIDDVVSSVPDGPPARFRWRRALHEIVAAEGPERIEGVWWNEAGRPVRDYYRVEDAAGLRFWVFREKLYDLRPRNDPRDKAEAERRATANKGETESTDKTGSAAAHCQIDALPAPSWFIHGAYA